MTSSPPPGEAALQGVPVAAAGVLGITRVAVAADHNGVAVRRWLIGWLADRGYVVVDFGTDDAEKVVDYPPRCAAVCTAVVSGQADVGVVVGGSGQGEVIACNKVRGIRAARCESAFTTQVARANNDANVLVLGAKLLDDARPEAIVAAWLTTPFSGGRHRTRLDQIAALERGELRQP